HRSWNLAELVRSCGRAPTAAGSGAAAAASSPIAEARNAYAPSKVLDRGVRIVRLDFLGADDQMHAGRRECVEPSRHCRLHRRARAGDPTSAAFPVPGVVRGVPRLATPHFIAWLICADWYSLGCIAIGDSASKLALDRGATLRCNR